MTTSSKRYAGPWFGMTALVLIIASTAIGQARHLDGSRKATRRAPVAKILGPVLQKIRNQTSVPILLPSNLPRSVDARAIRFIDGEGGNEGYQISLYYKRGCGNACFVGYFEAKRGDRVSQDKADRVVQLAKGIKGYYTAKSCGGSCTPPKIDWVHNGVWYVVQFNVNGKREGQDKAEMVALANSAIAGGER